jgi:hypothetical protein
MDRKKLLMYGGIGVLIVVLVGAVVGLLMGGRGVTVTISDTAVTNVRPTSTTIVWTTKESVVGSILVSEDGSFPSGMFANYEGMEFYDDRDVSEIEPGVFEVHQQTGLIPGYTHHVTIRGLEPEKTYYFALKHGDRIDIPEGNTFTTVPVLGQVYTPEPMYGMLANEEGMGVADGLVLVEREGMNGLTQVISTYLAPNGSYSIDVSGMYSEDFKGLYVGEDSDKYKLNFLVEIEGDIAYQEYDADVDKVQPVGILTIKVEDEISYLEETLMSFVGQVEAGLILDGQEIVIRQEGRPAPPPVYRAPAPIKKDDKKDDEEEECDVSYGCENNNPYKMQRNCVKHTLETCSSDSTCMTSSSDAWCQKKQIVDSGGRMLADDLIALGEAGYSVGAELEKLKNSNQADVLRTDENKVVVEKLIDRSVQADIQETKRASGVCFKNCQRLANEGLLEYTGAFSFLNRFLQFASAATQNISAQERGVCATLGFVPVETVNDCTFTYENSDVERRATIDQSFCVEDEKGNLYKQVCRKNSNNILEWTTFAEESNPSDCDYINAANYDEYDLVVRYDIGGANMECRKGSINCLNELQYEQCVESRQLDVLGESSGLIKTEWSSRVGVVAGYVCQHNMLVPVNTDFGLGCFKDGLSQCSNGKLALCVKENDSFVRKIIDCGAGETCNTRTGACEMIDNFPKCAGNKSQDTTECFNGNLRRCDHGTWKTSEVCSFGCSIDECNPSHGPDNCPPGQVSDVNTNSCVQQTLGCDIVANQTQYVLNHGESTCIQGVPATCSNGNFAYRPDDQKICSSSQPSRDANTPYPQNDIKEQTGNTKLKNILCGRFINIPDSYQACLNGDFAPEEIEEQLKRHMVDNTPPSGVNLDVFDWFAKLVSRVNAQDQQPEGEVISIMEDKVLSPGMYEIKYSETDTRTVELINGGRLTYFHDFNGDGVRNLNEPYVDEDIEVTIKKVAETVSYTLNTGWNLVSFPLSFDGENTSQIVRSSDLLQHINKLGGEATHITTYRGGKFIVFSERLDGSDTITFGTEFNLIPGEAYFIKSLKPSSFTVVGRKVEGSLPVNLEKGWNLVGIYNSAKESFGGFEVLKQINSQGVLARILSKWQDGGYQNLVVRDGVEYGNDYQVFPQSGYWVQNAGDGSGVYKPE